MSETRNIINHFAYWETEAIKADLDSRRHNFKVLCCNLYNDFNIATVIRNANAFLANEVIIYGSKQYDRRGTVGTHNYTTFKHFKEDQFDEMAEYIQKSFVVGVDNVPQASNISDYVWDAYCPTVMVFGQEQVGIPKNVLDICDSLVYIEQYGSVRSLNVGTASGIVMYDYCAKEISNARNQV